MINPLKSELEKTHNFIKGGLPESLWPKALKWCPIWAINHQEPPLLERSLKPGESGCKADVDLNGLSPVMFALWVDMVGVYSEIGSPCIITSALDGKHSERSLHYEGRALDFRTRHLTARQHQSLIIKAKRAADAIAKAYNEGRDYGKIRFDVVPEVSHLHIEADDAS